MNSETWINNLIADAPAVVKERREALGWTIYRAAASSGLSWQMVKQVEQGDRRPSLETFCRLAIGLKMMPSELLGKIEQRVGAVDMMPLES